MQWDTASLESRSQIFLGRYQSPTPDARRLPREERSSSEESLIFTWIFSYTNIDFIKQKEDQIIALVCMPECLTQNGTLCQCPCVVPAEPF